MSTHESGTAVELSIGEVLALIQEDFPDVTISKIRFLESQGLIQPGRTAAGYRRFGDGDIERLRWILRQQRDHFLPLKVIRRMLDDGIDQFDDDPAQPTLWSRSFADEADDSDDELDDDDLDDDFDDDDLDDDLDGAFGTALGGALGAASSDGAGAGARGRPATVSRHPGRGTVAPVSAPSVAAPSESADSDTAGDGPGTALEPEQRRVLETPADVVAALQEDPRPARRPAASSPSDAPEPRTRRRAALWDGASGADQPTRTAEELCDASGLSVDALSELEQYGLIRPATRAGESYYGDASLEVARLAARAATHGISARHLRMYLVSAEREAGFIEQLAMPLLKQRNPTARTDAVELSAEIAGLGAELHAALLRRELGPVLGDSTGD